MVDGFCIHERTRGEMGGRHHLLMFPIKGNIICVNQTCFKNIIRQNKYAI